MTRVLTAAWLTLVVTAGFAAWAGTRYASASAAPGSSLGQARDAALAAGRHEIADLNTVSVKDIARWQGRWLADTTGGEHTQIQESNGAAAAQIAKVKTSSAGTVTDAALTALTLAQGGHGTTATMIATLRVTQTNATGAKTTVHNRYQATLTLTSAGWKISSLTGG